MVHHLVGACLEKRIVQGPATARRRSELGNRRSLLHGQLSSPCSSGVGDLPTSSVSAVQLVLQYMCSARTPPLHRITLKYWCMLHVLFEFITLFSYTFHPVKSLPRDSPTISTIARLICLMRASSTPCAEHPPHASTHASTTHPELCDACWAAGA